MINRQMEQNTFLKDLEKKYFNLKVVTIDPHVISRIGKKFS